MKCLFYLLRFKQLHTATEHSICGWCDGGTKVLISLHFNFKWPRVAGGDCRPVQSRPSVRYQVRKAPFPHAINLVSGRIFFQLNYKFTVSGFSILAWTDSEDNEILYFVSTSFRGNTRALGWSVSAVGSVDWCVCDPVYTYVCAFTHTCHMKSWDCRTMLFSGKGYSVKN